MRRLSYAAKARGERKLMQMLFDDEQREKAGSQYGVEFGVRRPKDDGNTRLGGSIRPDHAVARRHGTSNITGLGRSGDRDFGVSDGAFGRAHVDGRLARRSYAPEQTSYRSPVAGAGRNAGPAWASTQRVRNSSGVEYDPNEGAIYGGRNSRGPF
jgi:hypothetical protein